MSRFKPRVCVNCGQNFLPTGAIESLCPECRKHGCCICGGPFLSYIDGKPYCRRHWTKLRDTGTLKYSRGVSACQFIENGDILEIITARGQEILVDIADKEKVMGKTWSISKNGYPMTYVGRKRTPLHKLLFGDKIGNGIVPDHINRNKRDNRRCNIRLCSQMNNSWNVGIGKRNTTGVR